MLNLRGWATVATSGKPNGQFTLSLKLPPWLVQSSARNILQGTSRPAATTPRRNGRCGTRTALIGCGHPPAQSCGFGVLQVLFSDPRYAVQVPPEGGDTCFADASRAFNALPMDAQHRLQSLEVLSSQASRSCHVPTLGGTP